MSGYLTAGVRTTVLRPPYGICRCYCHRLYHADQYRGYTRKSETDASREAVFVNSLYLKPFTYTQTSNRTNNHISKFSSTIFGPLTSPVITEYLSTRSLHSSVFLLKEDTRVEKSVKIIKEKVEEDKNVSSNKTLTQGTKSVQKSNETTQKKGFLAVKLEKWKALLAEMKKVGYFHYMWTGLKHFVRHYWDGFRLIWKNSKYCMPLLFRYLREGRSSLKRREYKMLTRTLADLIRMVPLIPMILIPLGEIFIPFYMSLNMMPSVFQNKPKTADYKRQLQIKLEYASLLANSLHEIPLRKAKSGATTVQDFADFMQKVKTTEKIPSIDEITKFSSLFEDSITLDDLNVTQLQALCKILGIGFLGKIPSAPVLRFQIIMKVRELEVDDKVIQKEGMDSLTTEELQAANRARGMRAVGLSEERLKVQLQQWLDLHLKSRVPTSLLLLTRVMYLDENLSPAAQLKETLKSLSNSTVDKVQVTAAETQGEEVDTEKKLRVLEEEHAAIKKEKEQEEKERKEEERLTKETTDKKQNDLKEMALKEMQQRVIDQELAEKLTTLQQEKAEDKITLQDVEPMVDTAPTVTAKPTEELKVEPSTVPEVVPVPEVITAETVVPPTVEDIEEDITAKDLGEIEKAIEDMAKHHKDELSEVKGDLDNYTEDMADIKALCENTDYAKQIEETKGAKKLHNYLNKYLHRLDKRITVVQTKKEELLETIEKQESRLLDETEHPPEILKAIEIKKGNLISVNEVLLSLKRLQNVPDDVRMQKVLQVLDTDEDGLIDINDVLKATELISQENLKLSKKQVSEMMTLLRKEAEIDLAEKQHEKEVKLKEEIQENGPIGNQEAVEGKQKEAEKEKMKG
ncbi:mitochondrial proton/calcium exchanger protein-like [Mya arenaria]|nr:mitochondrial proton/calcium exchanger protein-like [Mya arenaria]